MFRNPIKVLILTLFLFSNFFSLWAQQNTILIIADDLGSDYLGCFSNTTDTAVTPHIRQLADQGILFSLAWSAPVCSPARAGMFTGRFPFRTGVGTVISGTTSAQLDTAEVSLAHLLKYNAPQSYNTANVGKWHLHTQIPSQRLYPNLMGYDFYSGNFNGAINNYYSYQRIKNGQLDTVNNYATTQTIDDALAWMDTMNTSKPFFLWVAFNAPHSPFHLPPYTLCDTTGLPGTAADISANPKHYFKAAIQAMDTEMGRLFQYLTNHNLMDSTNIIFIGDNGNEIAVAQNANPSKAKATIYDYGVHVPMIFKGPAMVGNPRTNTSPVSTVDLFATILELSNFPNWHAYIPSTTVVDSRSLLPIIKNQSTSVREWTYTEQFANPSTLADGKTIRNKEYHLLRFDHGTEEFYHHSQDYEEVNDLMLSTSPSASDLANYYQLCDSLNTLLGTGTCLPLHANTLIPADQWVVYPNPATDKLWMLLPTGMNERNISLDLYSSMGEHVLHLEGQKEIQISGLSKGVYFVELNDQQARMTQVIRIE